MTRRRVQRIRVIGAVFLLVLQGSCALIPKGDPPADYLEPPEMKETLAEVTSRLQQWPEDRWWEQFGSPDLNRLMEAALRDNPGLKVASARLREAQGLVKVEGARLLPFLDADASLTYERISQHGVFAALNREVAGAKILLGVINPLSFRYEFDFWGKNRAMMEAALGQAAAHEAELAEARLHLTAGIARAYFRGLALRQQLDVIRQIVAIRRNLRRLAETRFQMGIDNDLAVKQAIADLEAANKREAGIRDQFDVQRHLLGRLGGKGPDEVKDLLVRDIVIPKHVQAPDQLPIGLLVHRPDLAAALYRAESASRSVKVAKTQFLPTIDLTGFVGFNALTLMTKGGNQLGNLLFNGQSFAYGVAPGLRLPWFEGGRLRGELTAQRAEYDAAVELYNETLLDAMREVADSLSAWKATREMLEAHHRLLDSLGDDWRLAKVRVVTGLDDDREALKHRNPVLEQEYALRALESDQLVAAVDLIEALGGGYNNPDILNRPKPESKPESKPASNPDRKQTS
jgi:NodT family efflux transporter outer membrane factor (OMF) lipoprotein